MSARYAIYYAPRENETLHRLMTPLLGRDALMPRTMPVAPLVPAGLPPRLWAALAGEPAHYGLHATLKAPFELSTDDVRTHAALKVACALLANQTPRFILSALELVRLHTHSGNQQTVFLALVPCRDDTASHDALTRLERDCVTRLDHFRAPLKEEDIARRGSLSEAELRNLHQWGYHRVLELFRFHITLTGPIREEDAALVEKALCNVLDPVLNAALSVDSICLFSQKERSAPFELLERFSLASDRNASYKRTYHENC